MVFGYWDLIIAHPPCTHLAVSGARWFKEKQADGRQQEAIDFFMRFTELKVKHLCIENPIGIMSTHYRKPDQIIQPYQFGHPTKKATCLWLKGLPLLHPTDIVEPVIDEYICKNGKVARFGHGIGQAMDENGKKYGFSDPMTEKIRSKTFPGIAKAMAEQWGGKR